MRPYCPFETIAGGGHVVARAGDGRFFESTRGQIVALLRQSAKTVDELARELDLTDNAVRLHLGTLERDGVAQPRGVRRGGGVGKPATEYEITVEAEPSFSNAYVPFLSTLLGALGDRMTPAQLRAIMRDVGHRLAGSPPESPASVAARTEMASKLLNALGGVTTVERDKEGKGLRIRGCGCPLSAVVGQREEVCVAMQTMLRDVIGVAVREECDRSGRPRCQFAVPL
jgi:predicted ArsR family transcriptional regulator